MSCPLLPHYWIILLTQHGNDPELLELHCCLLGLSAPASQEDHLASLVLFLCFSVEIDPWKGQNNEVNLYAVIAWSFFYEVQAIKKQ